MRLRCPKCGEVYGHHEDHVCRVAKPAVAEPVSKPKVAQPAVTVDAAPRKGRPRIGAVSIESRAPWRSAGMSRRTWYRRRKELAQQ